MYEINYEDQRFKDVEAQRNQALSENEKLYGGMATESDKYYQAQIDASKNWAEEQKKNQQALTDFAIEKIDQQKAQAKKDYIKNQSGAYVDWQKESNRYGANAEAQAQLGLTNTGYSESSQVSLFNTYQNRVASARESYNIAVLNYDNAIKDAQLQNNSLLAEIAYNSLQQQLELSLQGFQYKNQLLIEKANQKTQINSRYDTKYQNVLAQMNTENALQEQIRQYNETLAEQKRQHNETLAEQKRQFDAQMALKTASASSGGGGGSSRSSSKKSSSSSSGSGSISKSSGGNYTSYSQAAQALQKAGATKGDGGLMTKSEWQRRKAAGSADATNAPTYNSYLNTYVTWKKQNPD